MGAVRGATTRVMPQPLTAQLGAREHVLPFPQLHCGAMPFLGMAASVVVVVQVLVMDFFRVLAQDLLYQAGLLFCFVLSLFLLLAFPPFILPPLTPRNVSSASSSFLSRFSSGRPLSRWTAALHRRPLDSNESGPPTAGGTTGVLQPKAGPPPAKQQ